MKRTMLALTLIVLFASASVGFGASSHGVSGNSNDGELKPPANASSPSSAALGDPTGNYWANNGATFEDPSVAPMESSILYTVLGLLGFGA